MTDQTAHLIYVWLTNLKISVLFFGRRGVIFTPLGKIGIVPEQEVVTDLDLFAHLWVGVFSLRLIWDR